MALAVGMKLGPYEITGSLGVGGMGEVYRARDSKLNRDIAIKVLPERFAQDPAALARFEREAQAVAALSHPNILAIHDFGTQGGITYAVTELLEGDTLRGRLAQGALPVRKAVDYGVHIVLGIAAAHERGIVHRDLKPENVFVTNEGVVKILDFGLAKQNEATDNAGGRGEARTMAATDPGTVLGTVGYMSPEQVRGQTVDHRTDIFSFGAILYELLTGRRAFRGDSHVETMGAILREDPPEFSEVSPGVPGSLERIIRRCLEKQPNDRFHSAHDLALALEALSGATHHSAASMAVSGSPAPRRKVSLITAAAALVVVGAGTFFAGRGMGAGAEPGVVDFQRLTYRRGPIRSASLAPDGATFVYSAVWEGSSPQIYSTRRESPESLAMPYTNADVASISSKGELAIIKDRTQLTAFARTGTLARAPMSGGAARELLEGVQHADWLPDGSDLAVSRQIDGNYRLEFPIGKVVYETTGWISHVSVSPDGKQVAFLDQPIVGDDRGGVSVVDAAGTVKKLGGECESTQGIGWAPSGREIWFACATKGLSRALQAVTLEGRRRMVLQVPGGLMLGDIGADGAVLLSHDNARRGIMGLGPGAREPQDLSWLDWSQAKALSADGRTLLIAEEGEGGGPGYGTFLRKIDGSPAIRLGSGEGLALSPDGRWVIAQKLDPSPVQLVLLPTGAGQARPLTNDDITHVTAEFLPDGKRFIFNGFKPGKPSRAWIQSLDGGDPTPILPEGATFLRVSPDGAWIAVRDLDGQRKLYPTKPDSATPQVIRFEPGEGLIRFGVDSRTLLVRKPLPGGSAQVVKLDLVTGVRTPIRVINALPEFAASGGVGALHMTPDGSAYIYGYGVSHSALFLVKGLK